MRPNPSHEAFGRHRLFFGRARAVVSAFYAFLVFLGYGAIVNLRYGSKNSIEQAAERVWCVFWAPWVEPEVGRALVAVLLTGGALAAAALPGLRAARLLCCLGLWEYIAYMMLFGGIDVTMHQWALCAFLLVFLPDAAWSQAQPPLRTRQRFLLVFGACQAALLLSYSMAGVAKIITAVHQFQRGEPTAFSLQGLSYLIASGIFESNYRPWLADWLIGHPQLGRGLYVSVIAFETISLWAAFRPALQAFWGLGLIALHIGTFLTVGGVFTESVMLVALLLLAATGGISDRAASNGARRYPLR